MNLRRYTLALVFFTFPQLIVGGLVHNTRSSLACPDWPLCFGSWFPKMVGEVLVEHGHRIYGTAVGILTIGLLIGLWRRARRTGERDLLWLGTLALGLVILQGVLGGLTVIFRLPTLVSTAHLANSMLFFSLLIYTWFRLRPTSVESQPALSPQLVQATAVAVTVVYVQMLLGALMRHLGAGLACTDLPLCRGEVWPTGAHPNVLLHVVHRLNVFLVFAVTLWVAFAARSVAAERNRAARTMATLAPVLVLMQATLGWLSITTFLDVVPVTAHLGVAALLLADLVALHLLARGVRTRPAARLRRTSLVSPAIKRDSSTEVTA